MTGMRPKPSAMRPSRATPSPPMPVESPINNADASAIRVGMYSIPMTTADENVPIKSAPDNPSAIHANAPGSSKYDASTSGTKVQGK
jgi:hypothetical protein